MKRIFLVVGTVVALTFNGSAHAGMVRSWSRTMTPVSGKGNEVVNGTVQFLDHQHVAHWTTAADNCNSIGQGDGYGVYFQVILQTPVWDAMRNVHRVTTGCGTGDTWGRPEDHVDYDGAIRNLKGVLITYGLTESGNNYLQGSVCQPNSEYAGSPAC